jgi:hypothetical protein
MSETPAAPYALPAGQGWTYNPGPGWTNTFDVDFVVKVGEQGQGRRLAIVEYTTRAGQEPPDHDRVRGWGGFVADFERQWQLRDRPTWDR